MTTRAEQLRTWTFLKDLGDDIRAIDRHLNSAASIAESIEDDRFGFTVKKIAEIRAAMAELRLHLQASGFTIGGQRHVPE